MICSVDGTVWPSSTQYMMECLALLQNICSLSPCNVGHVQTPLFHQATSMAALLKHIRKLEDALLKGELDIAQRVTLLFTKESSRSSVDKRPLTQPCISPFASKTNKWQDCEAHTAGVISGLTLMKVSDMQGYDPESGSRPGAAARLEKILGEECSKFLRPVSFFLSLFSFSFVWHGLIVMGAAPRKGIPCHRMIVEGYLRGMNFSDKDVVVWMDVLPNQLLELACSPEALYFPV